MLMDTMVREFCSITEFCNRLGFTRGWYYKHEGEPGLPVRVFIEGEPRLVVSQCDAYVDAVLKKAREAVTPPPLAPETTKAPPKRGPGRPPKRQLTPRA